MARGGSAITGEEGFSLAEVLVALVIIAIVAAIALPSFLSQQRKGHDAEAKTSARELQSHVEACFVEADSYAKCDSPGELPTIMNLAYGSAGGEVEIVGAGASSYTIIGHSRTGADFRITKTAGGAPVRACSPRDGGCGNDGTW